MTSYRKIMIQFMLISSLLAGCTPLVEATQPADPTINMKSTVASEPMATATATTVPTEASEPTTTDAPTPIPTKIESGLKLELPEKFEDLQLIKIEDAGKIYDLMKKHYDEVGWPVQPVSSSGGHPPAAFPYLPAVIVNITMTTPDSIKGSMFKVEGEGAEMYLIVLPVTHNNNNGNGVLDNTLFCFLLNPYATKQFINSQDATFYDQLYSPEAIFDKLKQGTGRYVYARILTSQEPNEKIIQSQGWQPSMDVITRSKILYRLSTKLLNYFAGLFDEVTRDAIFANAMPVFDISIQ